MSAAARLAPAKINLTLEVLGKRPDGYHEIRSVMTTIGLYDTVLVENGTGVMVSAGEDYDPLGLPVGRGEQNTAERALQLLARRRLPSETGDSVSDREALNYGTSRVALRLHKEIPAAAGLGGGSSDGAATLLALNEYWSLGLDMAELENLAAAIGSDCPFFVRGGVQLAAGRGETLTPLQPPAPTWVCVLHPPILKPNKTAALYALLRPSHYTDGTRSEALARRLAAQAGVRVDADECFNVFDVVADEAYGSLELYRRALGEQSASAIHLCGTGPSLYGLFANEPACRTAVEALRVEHYDAWSAPLPAPCR